MSLKITVFVCLLANVLFSYHGFEAKSVGTPKKTESIADVIINHKNICDPTRNIVSHSKYFQECGKIEFSTKFVNLTEKNVNEFLCLAIYAELVKISQDDTTGKNIDKKDACVLKNQTTFETQIETALKSNRSNPWNFCSNLKKLSLPVLDGIKLFVDQLKSMLDSKKHCVDICVLQSDAINPLCFVLEIIDQQLHGTVDNSTKGIENVPNISAQEHKNANVLKIIGTGSAGHVGDANSRNPTRAGAENITINKNSTNNDETSKSPAQGMDEASKTPSGISSSGGNPKTSNHETNGNAKPATTPEKSSVKDETEETAQNPLDVFESIKKNDAANNGKPIATSGKTVNDNQANQSSEYNIDMTDDTDQISELENGDVMDDIQSPNTKQNEQFNIDQNDRKEIIPRRQSVHEEDDSHFFGYFTIIGLIGISVCLVYHHKQKILAIIVEGRRSRGARGRKRPSTANYRKLDCNLEEAVTSQCNANVTHVIY